MVLGSPSASTAAKLVFWTETDPHPSDSGPGGGDAGTTELDDRGTSGESMYVTLFVDMLKEILTSEAHLWLQEELDCFMAWHKLPYNEKYLFCRLCLRKTDKWHRYSSLKYEQELGADGILAAIKSLCKANKDKDQVDVKPKLEDLNTNIPDLDPEFKLKVEEEDVKPKLEPTDPSVPADASMRLRGSKQPAPEFIDLTMDEADDVPQAGPSSSPAVEPPSSSAPSYHSSTQGADYTAFVVDEEQADIFELLDCLTTPELDDLAKQLKLKPKGGKKRDYLIDAILDGSAKQTTLPFHKSKKGKEPMVQTKLPFGAKKTSKSLAQSILPFKPTPESQRTQRERVRAIVTQKLTKCIRLNPDVVVLFRRANLVYFRSTQYTLELLTPALLARAKRREYAAYKSARTSAIWPAREDLLAYEDALAVEAQVDALLDGTGLGRAGPNGGRDRSTASRTPVPVVTNRFMTPVTPGRASSVPDSPVAVKSESGEEERERVRNAREVKKLMETVYPNWIDLVQTKGEENPRRKGLERFDCGHILTRVVCKGAAALSILKEYEEELNVLETLLAQRRWRRGRRGRWYDRRALVLMTHLKDEDGRYEQAMEVVIAGLEDPDTHIVFRPMLERRLTRLEKKLKVPPEECHVCEAGLKAATDVYVEGTRIHKRAGSIVLDTAGRVVGNGPVNTQILSWSNRREPPPKKPKEDKSEKGGKSIWKGRDDEVVNVEIFALQHYEDQGCKGHVAFTLFHCEGRIVTTLFGLLFWDIIFAPIPGAFEMQYQSAPWDLAEDTFYYSRQELIEARLEEIRSGDAAEILERTYDAHKNVMCVGVRWDLFPREDLLSIVRCMDANVLVAICRLMCEDYGARAAGVPDLIVWNEDEGYAKFVEVKGPGDTLQENQKVWIDVLLQAGLPVEVCHVYEQGDEPKRKKGKTPKKEKVGKKAGQKRKRDDWLVESEDEEIDYSQLDRHTDDEEEEEAVGPSPKKRRTRANGGQPSPESPVARKVVRINSQVEVVITSTPSSSRHPSSSPSQSKAAPSKSQGSPAKGRK